MKNEIIVELFESKDKRRRRCLYDLYGDIINMKASIFFICKLINKELARDDLVTEKDVVYCRFHFSKKSAQTLNSQKTTLTSSEKNQKVENGNTEILWSDPDGDNYKKQASIKSKFSKQ